MLKPREADIPALFLVLVVLPLVTYVLLGKWNDAAKRKSRINALAQLAAEETFRVEEIATSAFTPLVQPAKTTTHECARCFRPATTRCSRCKSARYCSGKCQIIHWRQGHKQECQQLDICKSNLSASPASKESSCISSSWTEYPNNLLFDYEHHEPVLESIAPNESVCPLGTSLVDNAIQHSMIERICSEKCVSCKFSRGNSDREDSILCGYSEAANCVGATSLTSATPSNFSQLKDYHQRKKLSKDNSIEASERNSKKNNSSNHSISERSIPQPPYRLTSKNGVASGTINASCIPKSLYSEMRGTNGNSCEMDFMCGNDNYLQKEFPSQNEAFDLTTSNENVMFEENTGSGSSLDVSASEVFISQRSMRKGRREHTCAVGKKEVAVKNKHKIPQELASEAIPVELETNNGILKIGGMKMLGLKKLPKLTRRQSTALTGDNLKKNMVLFPYEDLVKLFHCEVLDLHPRGLLNCGNSCYANAVLQCLTCTKPLIVYLLQRSHSRTCCGRDWCLVCELELHVSMLREGAGPLSPSRILSHMQNIGCQMGGGDQEDAHEFLRLLVTSMQSICLKGFGGEKAVESRLQETTLIQQIFGGHLRSKVKCLRCHHESERYENIMDLTLEILGWVESLEDALTQFTSPEDLDGENMYRCERCAAYVQARKQLSIHEAPNILTIVLKRFQTGKYGKINKSITFPDMLDMIPFMTGTGDSPPLYMLYGVVVHLDTLNASFSGHYVSYVKDLQGTWFRIDDAQVEPVPVGQVMSEGAYILFYSRSYPRPPRAYGGGAALPQASATAKQCPYRIQKSSGDQQHKRKDLLFPPGHSTQPYRTYDGDFLNELNYSQTSNHGLTASNNNMLPIRQSYMEAMGMDFSDATSSDWSLFTSSDESSFTTESTRDSFSTIDYNDTLTMDPISSIFGTYSTADYSNGTLSCTKFSPSRPQTRYFQESNGVILDSSLSTKPVDAVHKGKNLEHMTIPLNESRSPSANNCSMFVRYGTSPKDSFVRTSGCL